MLLERFFIIAFKIFFVHFYKKWVMIKVLLILLYEYIKSKYDIKEHNKWLILIVNRNLT